VGPTIVTSPPTARVLVADAKVRVEAVPEAFPSVREFACAAQPLWIVTVPTVVIETLSLTPGIPLGDQFAAVHQVLLPPIQVFVPPAAFVSEKLAAGLEPPAALAETL
jgi:hypothetical protein